MPTTGSRKYSPRKEILRGILDNGETWHVSLGIPALEIRVCPPDKQKTQTQGDMMFKVDLVSLCLYQRLLTRKIFSNENSAMSQIFSVLVHLMIIASPRLKSIDLTGVHSVNVSGCLTVALHPDSHQRHISPRSYIQTSFPYLSQSLLHSCFYFSKSIRTHLAL